MRNYWILIYFYFFSNKSFINKISKVLLNLGPKKLIEYAAAVYIYLNINSCIILNLQVHK